MLRRLALEISCLPHIAEWVRWARSDPFFPAGPVQAVVFVLFNFGWHCDCEARGWDI